MKALVGAFNQEKALVGAFSVIVQLHRLIDLRHYYLTSMVQVEGGELLGRGQGREGLLDDDLGLVQGVCVRDRGGQEHRAAGDPGRGRDGAHHPPRLGPARRPRQVTVSRHSLAAGGCLV